MIVALRQNAHRLGAVCYVLWGILHIYAAYLSYQLALDEPSGFAQGKLLQNAWSLAYISLLCIFVAAVWNWNNSRTGYWLNLFTVSVTDIGFLVLIYAPGYSTDLIGPALWLLALALTTVGYMANARTA